MSHPIHFGIILSGDFHQKTQLSYFLSIIEISQ